MQSYFSGKHMNNVVGIGALCILFTKVFFCYLCRGDDGELRLGVRRAVQLKNEALFEEFSSDSAKRHTLSAVYDSLKHKSVFHISYNPRFVDLAYTVRSGMLYIKHVILAWYNMALLMTYCKKLNSKVK